MTTAPPAAGPDAPASSGPAAAPAPAPARHRLRALLVLGLLVAWLVAAAAWHLTQGTADVTVGALWRALTGQGGLDQAAAVVTASRLPRLAAGVLVGCALGASGAALQGVARNPLAAPDTLAVNSGAHLAVTAAAVVGASLGALPGVVVAFAGGLAAAGVVIGLSGGAGASPVRLVLAGSAITLGLSSVTQALLVLFPWETQGLFAWGAGSLGQNGMGTVRTVAPIVVLAFAGLLLVARRLDLLQLGDDAARSLGVDVVRTRLVTVLLAVLLATCAVTVTGPIGFVGLCAPLLVRLLATWVRPLTKHRLLIPAAAVAGTALVLTADVALRAVFGPISGVTVPTGVVTSLIGAVALIVLARRARTALEPDTLVTLRAGSPLSRRAPALLLGAALVLLAGVLVAGVLLGDSTVLLGDVHNWLAGRASVRLDIVLDSRVPRVAAALLAGACLALAGGLVQTVTRNPLADPGVLGVSHAAGLGAVVVIVAAGAPSFAAVFAGAVVGAVLAGLLVFGVTAGTGLASGRMVLVGLGTGAAASAVTTLLLVRTDPWNQNRAITWLGGSTFGAGLPQLVPMAVALLAGVLVVARTHRDLDLVQVDDVTPRVLGVDLPRSRALHVGVAVLLTAAATAAIGPVVFVGLVAPHAARMLIGKRHRWLLPMTVVLGAALVGIADAVGRTAIAPAQLPAGLVTAVVGTPYFLWLLWRMRVARGR
ncbi:iron-hydroxamate transporter permease subunit [Cellulomonas hominis]|uniref:Iron complex transport system permease protein n=1 Tax=Cellulomonas hominis TaxID=156981 RepID=A0A511FD31_9CELL|nr:iron ABC transporter permease [Cellulomonas hominis]MBB5475203.1 iron complex transport system permease protein [Cellulomonas hominis]GEL47112.1 iron-hydroxamate transporter permease subunit [Cellulomonas hominis]